MKIFSRSRKGEAATTITTSSNRSNRSNPPPTPFFPGIFEYIITNKTVLAYRHFFSIVHTPPLDPKYNEFKQIVDRYLELPPFNLTNHLKEETTNISRMVTTILLVEIKKHTGRNNINENCPHAVLP